jgi:hypothetical protein
VSVKKKEIDGHEDVFEWKIVEPWPADWVWVERNGMRVRPAKGRLCDLVLPPDRPRLTDEEIDELLRPDREDER